MASLGLGGLTLSLWIAKYRWVFMTLTFLFLGGAFYKNYRDRKSAGKWSIRMLYMTTLLSIGFVGYSLLFR